METSKSQNNTSNDKHSQLNYEAVKKAAMILRAINHKHRQQIIKLLEENKRMKVTAIYVKLRLTQPIASQHLAVLRSARILTFMREGQVIFYSLNYKRINEIDNYLNKFMHESL